MPTRRNLLKLALAAPTVELISSTLPVHAQELPRNNSVSQSSNRKKEVVVLRLQIIQVLDDEGNGIPLNSSDIRRMISELNRLFLPANVNFLCEKGDISVIRNSYLSMDFDPETNEEILSNSSVKPKFKNEDKHIFALQKESLSFQKKIPVFVISGSDYKWDSNIGKWVLTQSGFSHGYPNFIYVRSLNVVYHELGHLFGLVHPNKVEADDIESLIGNIKSKMDSGYSLKDAIADFELDEKFGVLDTLPNPGAAFFTKYQPDRSFDIKIPLLNNETTTVRMDCRNAMGGCFAPFSKDQCEVIYSNALMWSRSGGGLPTNNYKKYEGSSQVFLFSLMKKITELSVINRRFGNWYGQNEYIEGSLKNGERISFEIESNIKGVCNITLFAGCAIDYGIFEFYINKTPAGTIDLWGPHWFPDGSPEPKPSGGFIFKDVEIKEGKNSFEFHCIGQHRLSKGRKIGLDSLVISKLV